MAVVAASKIDRRIAVSFDGGHQARRSSARGRMRAIRSCSRSSRSKPGLTGRAFARRRARGGGRGRRRRRGARGRPGRNRRPRRGTRFPLESDSFDVAVVRDVPAAPRRHRRCGVCRRNRAGTPARGTMSRDRWSTFERGICRPGRGRIRSRRLHYAGRPGADSHRRKDSRPRACSPSARGWCSRKRSSRLRYVIVVR